METSGGEWKESVQLVLEYFCERTPRSFVEQRGTSLVWNYKYADVEFGRIQARDLLQHLLTGPISNAPVDIVRGSRSIEVRPVGVSKGSSMERILQIMGGVAGVAETDFVLVAGHFLARDENIFTLFEGHRYFPAGGTGHDERDPALGILEEINGSSDLAALDRLPRSLNDEDGGDAGGRAAAPAVGSRAAAAAAAEQSRRRAPPPHAGHAELPFPLPPKHLFTCTVGRSMASKAK